MTPWKFKAPRGGLKRQQRPFLPLLPAAPHTSSRFPASGVVIRRMLLLFFFFFVLLRGCCLEPFFSLGSPPPSPSCPDSLPPRGILQINRLGWARWVASEAFSAPSCVFVSLPPRFLSSDAAKLCPAKKNVTLFFFYINFEAFFWWDVWQCSLVTHGKKNLSWHFK